MKQKKTILLGIAVILMLVSICACTSNNGVPESVVMYDFDDEIQYIDEPLDCRVVHNYDPDSHIDAAQFIFSYETEYAKQTGTIRCWYQYNSASDLWELLESEDCVYKTELKDYFTDVKPHSGSDEDTNYALYIDEIDTKNMTISVGYSILYDGKSYMDPDSTTYDLTYVSEWGCYYFSIELPIKTWGGDYVTATFRLGENGIGFWCV